MDPDIKHILVVDDDETVCKSLAAMLEACGWSVQIALSGKEAMGYLEERSFDIVLMDVSMPRQDGLATLSEIRQLREDIPVVLTTGHEPLDFRQESRNPKPKLEPDGWIKKPFRNDDLQEVLGETLRLFGTDADSTPDNPSAPSE